jgi:predicted nucleic acid-binding protein
MANYLLDTNHLSMLVNVGHPLRERVIRQRRIGDEFSIATPALAEFLFGIQMIKHAKENMNQWRNMQELFSYYEHERL